MRPTATSTVTKLCTTSQRFGGTHALKTTAITAVYSIQAFWGSHIRGNARRGVSCTNEPPKKDPYFECQKQCLTHLELASKAAKHIFHLCMTICRRKFPRLRQTRSLRNTRRFTGIGDAEDRALQMAFLKLLI